MAADDYGIVVGISKYPDISELFGTENDAQAFYDWLVSPEGGDVPPGRVVPILSSQYQPVAPAVAVRLPTADAIERAFNYLQNAALGANGVPKRFGRRLYVYVAGHGAALPFSYDPDRADAAFLVADATRYNATHVMARVFALYFLNAGIFDEIVVFMDCCRIVYTRLVPRFPTYIDINAISDSTLERRAFFAFATKWALTAREKQFGVQSRGVFTTALMNGLQGAAANPDGTVTSSSLRNYLLNHMRDLLSPDELADPEIPKQPDIPAPAVDLILATVKPPRVSLTVTFPQSAGGQMIRLRGDGFKVIASAQTQAGVPWSCDDLTRGGYMVEIPAAGLEQAFTLIGSEGAIRVAL